jgi:hypothetical protein
MARPSAARTVAAGALVSALASGSVLAQDILLEKGATAPRTGERSRPKDHYTPYFPPTTAELPADAKIHIIVKGDTLWDLARTYLGDPYFWPQIWEANPYISDPHWIFPGDPLVIPTPMVIAEVRPPEPPPVTLEELPAPQPVAKRYDVYCAPYVLYSNKRAERLLYRGRPIEPTEVEAAAALKEVEVARGSTMWASAEVEAKRRRLAFKRIKATAFAPVIMAGENGKVALGEGDVAYVNRGEADGVKAGDEMFIVRPERAVYHPVTGVKAGIAMQMVGLMRILCTQDKTATAVVTSSCEDIRPGDFIRAFEPIPIPLASDMDRTPAHCARLSDRADGVVVYSKADKITMGEEDLLNIDLGGDAGLVPGDFLVLYRQNPVGQEFPNQILGDAVVLLVEPRTATAKIVNSYHDVTIGDRVRLR